MSNRERNEQRRNEKQRDRQIYYFSTLKQIAETLNKTADLRETVESTLPLVVELLSLHTGWLFLLDEQDTFYVATHHNLPPAMAFPGPPWCDACTCQRLAVNGELHTTAQVVECSRLYGAPGDRQGLAYHASIPLLENDHLMGILNVATSQWDLFTPQDLHILTAVGYQFATAIRRTQLAEQTTRIALIEERNRLAREVHDTLAQELAGIALQLEAADALLETAPARARERIQQALEQTRESLVEARRSVLDLRAGPLERQTLSEVLIELLERFAHETGIDTTHNILFDGPRLPARYEQALYRIVQEGLANIRQHTKASKVSITLYQVDDHIHLSIEDDGQGFDSGTIATYPSEKHTTRGFGLISMQERAYMLGGGMHVSSYPGSGTRIDVHIPL
ncbi:MAG: GAF domain-containing sensor histidine kinase [Chloroflexota bacterium]